MIIGLISLLVISGSYLQKPDSAEGWIEVNRVLVVRNDTVPADPFADSIRVAEEQFVEQGKPIIDSGGCVLPDETLPDFSVVDSSGGTVPVADYLKDSGYFSRVLLYFDIKITWTGEILYLALRKYRGAVNPRFDFLRFAKELRATPPKKFGFPYTYSGSIVFPIRWNRNEIQGDHK